jgi:hypothetical protein
VNNRTVRIILELNIELILKKLNSSVSIDKETFKDIAVSLMNKVY